MIEEKIFSLIHQSKNILLISHRKPDGDTVGSAGCFYYYIKNNLPNTKVTLFSVDPVPETLEFLNLNTIYKNNQQSTINNLFDLIITLDCGGIEQTGIVDFLRNRKNNILINVDHHASNNNYGDLNLVKPKASSTCEIVYNIFKKTNKPLTKEMTNLLLTGILTDTTYFSNAATTQNAVNSAAKLLSQGANIKQITKNVWQNKNLNTLKLWGQIFSNLIFNPEYQTVVAVVTQEEIKKYNLTPESIEGIPNFLTNLYDAKIILVLKEEPNNIIKGSLRTTYNHIDVAKLAQKLGGGGHKKASGFTIEGQLKKTSTSWEII